MDVSTFQVVTIVTSTQKLTELGIKCYSFFIKHCQLPATV